MKIFIISKFFVDNKEVPNEKLKAGIRPIHLTEGSKIFTITGMYGNQLSSRYYKNQSLLHRK